MSGEVWHVTVEGADNPECGTNTTDCRQLKSAIQLSDSGDHILLHRNIAELCGHLALTHSVLIEGFHGSLVGCGPCNDKNSTQGEVVVDISNDTTVEFFGITFVRVEFHVMNSRVEFNNCTFLQSILLLMDHTFLDMYDTKIFSKDAAPAEFVHFFEDSMCIHGSLVLNKTSFNGTGTTSLTFLDIYYKVGIQAFCKAVNIEIEQSVFLQQPFRAGGFELNLTMTNSHVTGEQTDSRVPSDFALTMYSSAFRIYFQNTTFERIYFPDLLALVLMQKYMKSAAFTLQVTDKSRSDTLPLEGNITFDDCAFLSNHRALYLSFSGGQNLFHMRNCEFAGNQADGEGGALFIEAKRTVPFQRVIIENCSFSNNEAGVLPFTTEVPDCGNRRLLSTVSVLECLYTGHSIFFVKLCVYSEATSARCTERTTHLDLSGHGGAIYVKNMHLDVISSSFWNNSATKQGGAISSWDSKLHLTQCMFHGPFARPRGQSGAQLGSHGTITLEGCEFFVYYASLSSVVDHSMFDIIGSGQLKTIFVLCPENSFIRYFNSSRSFLNEISGNSTQYYEVETFRYSCFPCQQKEYSLNRGYFNLTTHLDGNGLQVASINEARCLACPFGGKCDNSTGITSQPNYWGLVTDGEVSFYLCPAFYCCAQPDCPGYNICEEHRGGTLCGSCAHGYSESMLSTKCMPNDECAPWMYALSVTCTTIIFILFLTFHKDIKTFLFTSPKKFQIKTVKIASDKFKDLIKVKAVMENLAKSKMKVRTESTQTSEKDFLEAAGDEGVIFLLLVCYYFQDTSLVVLHGMYTKVSSGTATLLKKVIASVFQLKLNFLDFAKDSCIYPDFDPVRKAFVQVIYVPVMYYILICLVVVSSKLSSRYPKKTFFCKLSDKAIVGLTMSMLLSYQTLSVTLFNLVCCLTVGEKTVLFMDGNVECYTWWQWVSLYVIMSFIVPFSIYLAIAPKYMKNGQLSVANFFLGFSSPFVFGVVYWIRKCLPRRRTTPEESAKCRQYQTHVDTVYMLLQGPYNETQEHILQCKTQFCWLGILFMRRLFLAVLHTFVKNAMVKMSLITMVMFLYMMDTIYVKPCKGVVANLADMFSSSALVLLSVINLMKATFEAAKFEVKDGVILRVMFFVEDSLTLFIPLVVAGLIVVLILYRLVNWLYVQCVSYKEAKKCK